MDDIKATPDAPNPKHETQSQPKPESDTIGLDFGAKGGDQLHQEPVRQHEVQSRDFRIPDRILDRYGYTNGCPGCEAKRAGKDPRGHSANCRTRIDKESIEGYIGMERLVERSQDGGKPNDMPLRMLPPKMLIYNDTCIYIYMHTDTHMYFVLASSSLNSKYERSVRKRGNDLWNSRVWGNIYCLGSEICALGFWV